MKGTLDILKKYAVWLILLLCVDAFSALLLWLSGVQAFKAVIAVIVLWSVIFFGAIIGYVVFRDRKREKLFENFLSEPDAVNEEKLLRAVSGQEREQLRKLSAVLRENRNCLHDMSGELKDYEEYVESWAHETKTPLALLTMILDNHSDELPPQLHVKLDYVRSSLQENVNQMLYYARLKSSTKDYRFEPLRLKNSVEEVLEDYAPLLEEKKFTVVNGLGGETVYTDRRGLQFMLGQIVSNAVKYSSAQPVLTIKFAESEKENVLSVADNGTGVKAHDLPYIFQKGFTGDSTDSRKKATGMGLYLTKKMADDLNLKLDVQSEWGKGFKISISFPKVDCSEMLCSD